MTNPTSPRALDHEGGIAPDDEYLREPVPLTDQRGDGRVAACWFVIIVATVLILWAVVGAAWGWIK